MLNIDWASLWATIASWITSTGIKVLIAIVILLVTFKIINVVARKIEKSEKIPASWDKTITKTIAYAIKILLKVLVIVCLVGYLGIDTSGITALIASLGVCVGLAVNGTLSNLAGGVMIIITRPFKLDDFIKVADVEGTVEEIKITHTKIITPDNNTVYVPNSTASSATVVNYTEKGLRRLDEVFAISYKADFKKAEAIIASVVEGYEAVKKDPAPFINIIKHNGSSIDITCRVWVAPADYWPTHFALLEDIKTKFDEEGIEIPYQQLDVHVKND